MSPSNLNISIAVAQMRTAPGNVAQKLAWILRDITKARASGAKLIVFPELVTSDYMLGDRWEDEWFIREIQDGNDMLRKASVDTTVIWGSVKADWHKIGEDGRVRKYNAAFVAQNGRWVSNGVLDGWIPKTNLPKYRIFDDARHFYPAAKLAAEIGISLEQLLQPFVVMIDGKPVRLGVTICEDLWEDEYNTKPSIIYGHEGVDLGIAISQSPWTADKWKARDRMLTNRVKDMGCPILYVNSVGIQNNAKNLVWFDGGSCLMGADGEMRWMGPLNKEALSIINPIELMERRSVFTHPEGIEEKYDATIAAMREFYTSFKRVVIGLSGGIDSAVSLAMHVEAIGSDRVLAINMPTEFNSNTTRSLAAECAKNLGVEYRVVPIQDQYEARLKLLETAGYPDPLMFDRENVQARIRGQVLADISACEATRLGGRCGFTCNGNKTEVALNYFTLYGDGAGTTCFFGDVWKGEMYDFARLVNKRAGRDMIPQGIIDVVPSAELSPDQNVEEGKGDPIFYPFHDQLLRAFVERRWDPTVVIDFARDGSLERELDCAPGTIATYFPMRRELVDSIEWAWLQYSYEGKRHMLPPTFITSRRAFGFDRRETIADGQFTEAYKTLRNTFLKQEE